MYRGNLKNSTQKRRNIPNPSRAVRGQIIKPKTKKNLKFASQSVNTTQDVVSKSQNKKLSLALKYNLPSNVYDGSCIPPVDGAPHYYKLGEEKSEGKKQVQLIGEFLPTAAGTETRQLAASYWNLLLGPTQFIYWDPKAKNKLNKDKNCRDKLGKWIFIDKARDILEGQSPPTQCNNVIGNNGYLSLRDYNNWQRSVFGNEFRANEFRATKDTNFANLYNFFSENGGFLKFRKTCCWICGFPLYPGGLTVNNKTSTNPPCEHILPVVNAIFNLKLYQKEDNSFTRTHLHLLNEYPDHNPLESFTVEEINKMPDTKFPTIGNVQNESINSNALKQNYIDHIPQLNQLLKEYAWSHTCCNSIKDDYNLITTRKTDKISGNIYSLIPNQEKIEQLLDEIWGDCFNENISFLNKKYSSKIIITTNATNATIKKNWINARTYNMMTEFLEPICNYTNQIYSKVPLLYNLASIASIIHAVPIELRNLLLFSTISDDKLENEKVIEFISLNDIKLDDIKFKPDFEENANVVYSVANKIATIIQSNCNIISSTDSSRETRNRKPTTTSSEYITFLNTLFKTSNEKFTDIIIKDNMSCQEKKNIPYYNEIIAIYIYKTIDIKIYNFYKLMFMYLVKVDVNGLTIPERYIQELSTSTYYILLYQFLLDNIAIKNEAIENVAIKNLYENIINICNTFKKNEEKNVLSLLKKLDEPLVKMFWVCLQYLWPSSVDKDAFYIGNIVNDTVNAIHFREDEIYKTLEKFKELPSPDKRKKHKGQYESTSNVTDFARGLSITNSSTSGESAKIDHTTPGQDMEVDHTTPGQDMEVDDTPPVQVTEEDDTPPGQVTEEDDSTSKEIKEIKEDTNQFKSNLDVLVQELEKYNEFPTKEPVPAVPVPVKVWRPVWQPNKVNLPMQGVMTRTRAQMLYPTQRTSGGRKTKKKYKHRRPLKNK